jgi:ubiquinone/menaquinone biosynthesis C-methylase UbiE
VTHERVFTHQSAHRFGSAERQAWLEPDEVFERLEITPGMNIADIGAGMGYFAMPLAARLTAGGRVYAVEIRPEMLRALADEIAPGVPVDLVGGSAAATTLPDESQNIVFFGNVWHELGERDAALAEAERLLRWAGRIAIVDWRADCAPPPGPPSHQRVAGFEVSEQLRQTGWQGIEARRVGAYSYLVTGLRPRRLCAIGTAD